MRSEIYIGVDLGKRRDFTAIAVVERYAARTGWDAVRFCDVYEPRKALRWMERVRLGTSYPNVAGRIRRLTADLYSRGYTRCTVVVDATGVGDAVVDLLRSADLRAELVPVTISSGEHERRGKGGWIAPKHELVLSLQNLVAMQELIIPDELPMKEALMKELKSIGPDLQARNGHDDLVMALALAAWRMRERGFAGECGEGKLV